MNISQNTGAINKATVLKLITLVIEYPTEHVHTS